MTGETVSGLTRSFSDTETEAGEVSQEKGILRLYYTCLKFSGLTPASASESMVPDGKTQFKE